MEDHNIWMREDSSSSARLFSINKRDIVAAIFRHQRLVTVCTVAIVLGAVLAGLLMPQYVSEMKVLVKRDRVDPIVTAEQNPASVQVTNAVSEEEMNSEAELLKSDDVLRKVVIANNLQQKEHGLFGTRNEESAIERAVRKLRSNLSVDPGKKTNIIAVSYSSRNPQLAYSVLNSLASSYMEKHLEVNRAHGQYAFFEKQADQSKQSLADAEQQLAQFSQQTNSASPQLERDMTLQKLSDFKFSLEQTRASIRETQNRIAELQKLEGSTPERVTTQSVRRDNPQLLQKLKGTLLDLQLKREELLTKYQPSYRAVQEVDKQIADTQAAIDNENNRPMHDETTDSNPTNMWVKGEMAKAQTDLMSLQARERVTLASIAEYEQRAQNLQQADIQQQALLRNLKEQQTNYELYQRKREEARITDALDKGRILNVALAEKPGVPALPAHPAWMYALLGAIFAVVASIGLVFIAEYTDSSFRTPEEVADSLNMPVLAAIPQNREVEPVEAVPYAATGTDGLSLGVLNRSSLDMDQR